MFATLAADYPREPRPGEPDLLADADRRLADGEITPGEHRGPHARVHLDRPQGTGAVRPRHAHRWRRRRRGPASAAGRGPRWDQHGPDGPPARRGRGPRPHLLGGPDVARADHGRRLGMGRCEQRHHGQAGPPRAVHHGAAGRARRGVTGGARARPGGGAQPGDPRAGRGGMPDHPDRRGRAHDDRRRRGRVAPLRRDTAAADRRIGRPAPEPRALPRRHPPGRARDASSTARTSAISSTRSVGPTPGVSSSRSRRRSASSSAPSTRRARSSTTPR